MKLYRIKKSNIDKKGKGLYATKNIKEGTKIIDYVGKLITKKQTQDSDKYDNNKPIYLFIDGGEPTRLKGLKEVCKQAFAHDFIESFENGYDTIVGERGVRLSGGQLQRISLARALIKDPDILILDEATSALDINSEKYIQNTINNIYHSKTIVAIAHRLSTIQKADKIFVMKDGNLKEEGNFNTLLKLNGLFKKMVDDQTFIV